MARQDSRSLLKKKIIDAVNVIPAGKVTTYSAIGRHLAIVPGHVAHILGALSETESRYIPWQRVVADGGAIGRHSRSTDQMALLKADGVVVSPAGIVQDFAARLMSNAVATVSPKQFAKPSATQTGSAQRAARARGFKRHPG